MGRDAYRHIALSDSRVVQHSPRHLHVVAPGERQAELDSFVLALLLQRGNLRTKSVCRLSVLGGFGDLRFQLFDPGIPRSQLCLVCFRINVASNFGANFRAFDVPALRLRVVLLRLLLRLLFLPLPFDLLRLRAILLTVRI